MRSNIIILTTPENFKHIKSFKKNAILVQQFLKQFHYLK